MKAVQCIGGAIAGALAVVAVLAPPPAQASDPLAPIKSVVIEARSGRLCAPFTYSGALEGAAQEMVRRRTSGIQAFQVTGYNGTIAKVWGYGDPEREAINAAMDHGGFALSVNCEFTEFGVGFIRDGDNEEDTVGIVFGAPAPGPQQPSPAPLTPAPAAEPPAPPETAPTDAVEVSFIRGLQWTVNVSSSANIPGSCTYSATNPLLPGSNKNFTIGAKGSASFTVLAPPPFSTYHVVVSCKGVFDGKTVEFGHVEQDVTA